MHRLVTGMLVAGCLLLTVSQAVAQTNADLKAEVDALKQQVALLQAAAPAKADATTVQETKKVSEKVTTDAAQYAEDFKVVWCDGVWFKSSDKFALHVGGRMLIDWVWISGAGVERDLTNKTPLGAFDMAEFQDGVEMRSIRLLMEGTLYKFVNFKLEVDFHGDTELSTFDTPDGENPLNNKTGSGSDMVLKDAYIELTQIPVVGKFRIGHFKEPFGLEQQTDDLFLTFMERSAGNCLVPGYNFGFMAHDALLADASGAKRLTWAVGMFRQDNLGNAGPLGFVTLNPTDENLDGQPVHSDEGYSVTARVTGLPYYADKGEKLVHVGFSYSHRGNNDGGFARFMARPECDFFQYPMLDASINNADNLNLFGAEAALVYGPFSFQTEYTGASLNVSEPATTGSPFGVAYSADHTLCYNAFYAQASYFVTGEHRMYDTETGAFTRIRPKKNFREDGGWGAVELATRYSYLDLDEPPIATFNLGPNIGSRGEYNIWTLGVNWYLNPNTKIAANYIRACPDMTVTSSSFDIFMMRFQVDF
jgi:phosphate-selective porin OprO and OprP